MEFPTVSLVGCLQQGRPHGVHSVLQHVLPVHSLGAQRKLPVLGSNAKGLVFSQGCQKSVLGDSGSVLMSREAALGSPQKETQRNRSKSEEERDGEAGEGRKQYGEAVRQPHCLDIPWLGGMVEERVGLFPGLWAVRL